MRRCLTFLLFCTFASAGDHARPLGRFVTVGDSLSAGFQNFSLYSSETGGQEYGYAQLIAKQAGTDLLNPTVSYPGIPPALIAGDGVRITSDHEPITRATTVGARMNPDRLTRNLSVPSYTVANALSRTADLVSTADGQDALELTVF